MKRALVTCLAALLLLGGGPAGAPAAPASLPDIEDEVMCPTCNMPLNTAQSTQADDQRAFIRELIAEGRDKEQVKAALVAEYGEDVLADPGGDGFGLAAYLVPVLLIAALAAGLLALRPRRRRGADVAETPELSATDTARLDAELAQFDR